MPWYETPRPATFGYAVGLGEGAVVGARSSVFRHVVPWTVVAGSPVKFIKKRVLLADSPSDAGA